MADGVPPAPFPPELHPFRASVGAYANAKVKQFAVAFCKRLNLNVPPAQLDALVQETMGALAAHELANTGRALRLVLRHDCQSTGCGETGCLLCQYNPSRLCKRNIKAKYLIDDHLKAKCGAPLRVELVDETNTCVLEGLPAGMQLECHVMNGEKYKEICPENTLLSHAQLRSCIISHHSKALLKRDGGSEDQLRCFLQLERGQAVLSDLQATTSSEALLTGKAPTFRLLIWAVDASGEPVPNVTYVVSEYFVVATKRVKHAIKSDIPSVTDHVSKLVNIGKATVDKLGNLRGAAREEGFEINIPDDLNAVTNVGQFQRLVELSEVQTDLKNKVRHLLKLSPEKWEEVAQHAQAAVMPDFRPRAWWCPALKSGLLFSCKNGAVCMDQPIALIKMGSKTEEDQVIYMNQLDVQLYNTIPKLKMQAIHSWYLQSHPGWAIYNKEGRQTDGAAKYESEPVKRPLEQQGVRGGTPLGSNGGSASAFAIPPPARLPTPPVHNTSPNRPGLPQQDDKQQPGVLQQPLGELQLPIPLPSGGPARPGVPSTPFAHINFSPNLLQAFPQHGVNQDGGTGAAHAAPPGGGETAANNLFMPSGQVPSMTEQLPAEDGVTRENSNFLLGSLSMGSMGGNLGLLMGGSTFMANESFTGFNSFNQSLINGLQEPVVPGVIEGAPSLDEHPTKKARVEAVEAGP